MVLYALAVRKDKRTPLARKEHEVDTHGEAPRLVHCDYCGGTYVFGEISCPHCNAPGKTVGRLRQTPDLVPRVEMFSVALGNLPYRIQICPFFKKFVQKQPYIKCS